MQQAARSDKNPCKRARKADARTRTGDPFITSEVLYQLSYVGTAWKAGFEYSPVSPESLTVLPFVPLQLRTRVRSGS